MTPITVQLDRQDGRIDELEATYDPDTQRAIVEIELGTDDGRHGGIGVLSIQLAPVLLAAGYIQPDGTHHYVSTYCQHGRCTACRQSCKTCAAPCRHGCHEEAR